MVPETDERRRARRRPEPRPRPRANTGVDEALGADLRITRVEAIPVSIPYRLDA